MVPEKPSDWFGVRCIYRFGDSMYEERITLWRARDFAHAIELAEAETVECSEELPDSRTPIRYVGLAQAYRLFDEPGSGAEVFSLIRDSDLEPEAYLSRYFETGGEHTS